jgi:hypothetical protein
MNALHPIQMTDDECLAEIGTILARGVIHLLAPKSSPLPADLGDSSLDFTADQSGRATPETESKA